MRRTFVTKCQLRQVYLKLFCLGSGGDHQSDEKSILYFFQFLMNLKIWTDAVITEIATDTSQNTMK